MLTGETTSRSTHSEPNHSFRGEGLSDLSCERCRLTRTQGQAQRARPGPGGGWGAFSCQSTRPSANRGPCASVPSASSFSRPRCPGVNAMEHSLVLAAHTLAGVSYVVSGLSD